MSNSQSNNSNGRLVQMGSLPLPEEILKPIKMHRALLIIFATLLLVLLMNLAVARYLLNHTNNRGYWLITQKWELLKTAPAPVDWLVLGDSSGNQGMMPEIVEQELGGKSINLATTAGMVALEDVWMLEEYIERYGPPANVIIVHTYDAWRRGLRSVMMSKVPLPWGYWRDLTPSPELSARDVFNIFTSRYLPLYGENKTLISILTGGLEKPDTLVNVRYRLEPDGFRSVQHSNSWLAGVEAEEQLEFVSNNNFKMSQINRESLDQLVILANQNDMNIFLVNGPIHEDLPGSDVFLTHFSDLQNALSETAEQSPNLYYIPDLIPFPASLLVNYDHVTQEGAEKYTREIVSRIKAILEQVD